MTTQKLLKRRVRERMSKTGERYSAARKQVVAHREAEPQTDAPQTTWDIAAAEEIVSDARLTEQTGRDWATWIQILHEWGGETHSHGEIVEYLRSQHDVPSWWTQAVTNGFERATGIRAKHQQRTGFTVYASKTVAAPVERAYEAFVSDDRRAHWLTDGTASVRTSQPNKTARFDWEGGASRLLVTFEAKGAAKSGVHVSHERLATAKEGEQAKAAWKGRLTALSAYLAVEAKGN